MFEEHHCNYGSSFLHVYIINEINIVSNTKCVVINKLSKGVFANCGISATVANTTSKAGGCEDSLAMVRGGKCILYQDSNLHSGLNNF